MFRFIHAADIHLDGPLRGLARYEGAPADAVREASRRALENLVDLALERRAAFLLLAGDVYDGDWKDCNTGLFFNAQMSRLRAAGVPVLLVHGNHDAPSVITKTKSLKPPDNVFTFPVDKPYSHFINKYGAVVHGQSYATQRIQDNLAAGYPEPLPGFFNIGLLHTSLETPGPDKRYAPCSRADLAARAYQYWALGHRHNFQVLAEDPPTLFCGSIQGRDATEQGPHGCVLVEVADDHAVSYQRVALDVMRWAELKVDATGAPDLEAVLGALAAALDQALAAAEGRPLAARVRLTGPCLAHGILSRDRTLLEAQVRGAATDRSGGRAWVEKVLLETSPAMDLEKLSRNDRPIGDLLRYLEELARDPAALAEMVKRDKDLAALPREALAGNENLDLGDPRALAEMLPRVRDLLLPLLLAGGDDS